MCLLATMHFERRFGIFNFQAENHWASLKDSICKMSFLAKFNCCSSTASWPTQANLLYSVHDTHTVHNWGKTKLIVNQNKKSQLLTEV